MSSGTGPMLFSLCTTIGFDLSFSRKSWHFCTSVAVSGSTGYLETEAETQADEVDEVGGVDEEPNVEVEAEAEADDGRSSDGGGTFSGGCCERWIDGITCIGAECVTTLATAARSTSRSSSGGISSTLHKHTHTGRPGYHQLHSPTQSNPDAWAIHAPFDPRNHVPVHHPAFDNSEPVRAVRLDDAPPIREQLHIADLEHRPVLIEKPAVALG